MKKWILWTSEQKADRNGRLHDAIEDYSGYDDYTDAFDYMIKVLREAKEADGYAEAMIFEADRGADFTVSGLWTSEDSELDEAEKYRAIED